jgi:hypothetical protein
VTRRERGTRSVADQLVRELGAGRRPGPLLVLWRWRWELGLVGAAVALSHLVQPDMLLAVAGVVVALLAAVPALRRQARDRFWCVATQHRLRSGLHEADVRSWSGRMPAIVWTSPRPHGERVLLALPAGVDVRRVAAAGSELAAACWAADVVVRAHDRYGNLAVVEVVRRGPAAMHDGREEP